MPALPHAPQKAKPSIVNGDRAAVFCALPECKRGCRENKLQALGDWENTVVFDLSVEPEKRHRIGTPRARGRKQGADSRGVPFKRLYQGPEQVRALPQTETSGIRSGALLGSEDRGP